MLVLYSLWFRAVGVVRRDDGHPFNRRVDLIGEVRERVRERIVDRALRRLTRIETRELAIARVRAHELQLGIEDGESKGNGLEQKLEASDLVALSAEIQISVRRCHEKPKPAVAGS